MSKFVHQASYYLDDKDLSDLFEAQNVAQRFLLKLARRRGLFLSEKASREELVHALCMAPISREEVNAIAEAVNTEDRESRQMTKQLIGRQDPAVTSALEQVKGWLEERGEVASLTKTGESSYKLECRFVEVQPQRARPLQRIERLVTIEVEIVAGRVDIRYSEHEHAKAIVKRLSDEIPVKVPSARSEWSVSLWSVRDAQTRIKFFTELINGVDGFVLAGVSDLHLDRRFPGDGEASGEEVKGEKTDKRKKELEGLVKHAVLFGDSLLKSEFYLELTDSGYYISSVKWTANEAGGDQRQVEFYAGFRDPIEATDFLFDVRRVAKRDKAGDYGKAERPHALERPVLLKLAEAAAYQAMERVEQKVAARADRAK